MVRLKNKLIIMVLVVFVLGCAQSKNFEYGVGQLNSVNSKYNTTIDTYPKDIPKINSMISGLKELKKLQLADGQESFYYAVNYRILNLEAENLYIDAEKYGNYGTTKYGFACKPRPIIIESVDLRNKSALKGFEAVDLLREFILKHPEDANSIGLSEKNALFLNATFYQIANDASADSNVINYFCPENVTLELYRTEFKKNTDLTDDYINKLSYVEAVTIWKKINLIG